MDKAQKVYVQLPNTGLGNKMLVWGRGFAFARAHGLEMFMSRWWGLSLGAWLRWERSKRLYYGYFREDGLLKRRRAKKILATHKKIAEPEQLQQTEEPVVYTFEKLFTGSDYFREMKPHRDAIKTAIYQMLSPALVRQLAKAKPPVIGVHIRRGDFKKGSTLTPLSFFIDAVQNIRTIAGKDLQVTIFSDAEDAELAELMALPEVARAPQQADILDILLLSQSQVCILSISSTFSFWAGFLCDGIVLKHPDEWHPAIRPESVNQQSYEGVFIPGDTCDSQLKEQIKKLGRGKG